MSVRVMTLVWDSDPGIVPVGRLLLLLALADAANDEGLCWPSVATLARKCRTSERTVQRHVADLADAGLLAVEDRPGRYSSRLYRIRLDALRGVTDCRARGDNGDARGVTLLSPEPSVEPSLEPPPQPPASGGGSGCAAHEDRPRRGCRACGTTPRQLAVAAKAASRPPEAFTKCPIHELERNGLGICPSCRSEQLATGTGS